MKINILSSLIQNNLVKVIHQNVQKPLSNVQTVGQLRMEGTSGWNDRSHFVLLGMTHA